MRFGLLRLVWTSSQAQKKRASNLGADKRKRRSKAPQGTSGTTLLGRDRAPSREGPRVRIPFTPAVSLRERRRARGTAIRDHWLIDVPLNEEPSRTEVHPLLVPGKKSVSHDHAVCSECRWREKTLRLHLGRPRSQRMATDNRSAHRLKLRS